MGAPFSSDLTGRVFGLLSVVSRCGTSRYGTTGAAQSVWLCRCACGSEVEVKRKRLIDGRRRYCERKRHPAEFAEARAAIIRPTAMTRVFASTYSTWTRMRARCAPGGKYRRFGITVCERWEASFAAFLDDMGARPSLEHSIDRIETLGNYEPGNCRWALPVVQNANKRTTRWIEWEGRRQRLKAVCDHLGLDYRRIGSRLADGWSVERALSEPVVPRGPYRKAGLDRAL